MREQDIFPGFSLDRASGTLSSAAGQVRLRPKTQEVLTHLMENAGRAVSKAELLDAVWPDVTVTEDSLTQCIHEIRRALNDTTQQIVRTLPRRGYLFAASPESGTAPTQTDEVPVNIPSIAILPFVNLGGDRDHEVFADGLTEDVITRLSRLRWLFVAARNSSFSYRDKAVPTTQVGAELGVLYVLNGSVRRSGQRLRVSAQLSDTSTGLQIWAERYDFELADFFALQDHISERVIAAIEPKIYAVEHQRFESRPPASLDAWGLVMKAMPLVWTWGSGAEIQAADALLERAVAADPGYARANCLLAWTHAARVQLGLADASLLTVARARAQTALRRDPEDPWTHFASGYVHMVAREFDDAVAALDEAIALNPSLAFAHLILGSVYAYGGLADAGLQHLDVAEKMSPRDHTQAANLATRGLCHFMAGRLDEAIAHEKRAVALRPDFGTAWRTLTAAAGLAGYRDTAAHALSEARRLHPSLSVDWIETCHPIVHDKDRQRYIAGLKAAGLN